MATNRTFTRSNVHIELFAPYSNRFVLDISALDGTDQLGIGGVNDYSWQEITNGIGSISINDGFDIDAGLLPVIGGSSASFQITSATYNPLSDKKLKPNYVVRIRYQNIIHFFGVVDSFDVAIQKNSPYNLVNVSCVDLVSIGMRANGISGGDSTYGPGATPEFFVDVLAQYSVINQYAGTFNTYVLDIHGTSVTTLDQNRTTQNPLGDTISGAMQSEIGTVYATQNYALHGTSTIPTFRAFMRSALTNAQSNWAGETISDEIIDINFIYKHKMQGNSFKATMDNGTTVSNSKNLSSIAMNGEITTEYSTRHANSTQLNAFTTALANIPVPQLVASEVTVALYDQTYSFPEYQKPGNVVKVVWNSYSDYFYVNRARHEVTPDNWVITYELWKGL